jgi:hypothetical protein
MSSNDFGFLKEIEHDNHNHTSMVGGVENSDSDDGDVELGTVRVQLAAGAGAQLDRPVHRRASSKSAVIADFTSGKEEVRTQVASVRSGNFQNAIPAIERRLLDARNFLMPDRVVRREHEREISDLGVSKRGQYMVSSRNLSSRGGHSNGGNHSSNEQYCLRKVTVST